MRSLLLIMLSISLLTIGQSTFAAREKFAIEMEDAHYRGKGANHNTISLKKLLKEDYPDLKLKKNKLVAIEVIGKSKSGRGMATLVVNGRKVDQDSLDGIPRKFKRRASRTFDRVRLENERGLQGQWQLRLDGNIKIRTIVVIVKRTSQKPRRLKYVNLETKEFFKFVSNYNFYKVRRNGVHELKIKAISALVDIIAFDIVYRDGSTTSVNYLSGYLHRGETKSIRLNGDYIRFIRIKGTSPSIFRNPGKINLQLGVKQ